MIQISIQFFRNVGRESDDDVKMDQKRSSDDEEMP